MNDLPEYTRSQLALRNGQDKPEVWIAYKGLIYDVSSSRLWKNGKHYEHWAGQNLLMRRMMTGFFRIWM
jgi:predicted heme/steroid binding protein